MKKQYVVNYDELLLMEKSNSKFYNLEAVIAVGFCANSDRAIQFRQWATTVKKLIYSWLYE